jgi:hypothetical protein
MNKAKKKEKIKVEFTTHTLWTATWDAATAAKAAPQVTKALQAQFESSLKQSQDAIEKKVGVFENASLSEAAAHALIR